MRSPRLRLLSLAVLLPSIVTTSASSALRPFAPPEADKDGKYTISAPGIRAQFIPYGASISNLFIKDKHGVERDLVLGFDNATYYTLDTSHPHLGGVPGRYANRIKNSTFTIDGNVSKVLPNENGGLDTLHGGPDGWDWRNFTVVSHKSDSITFSLTDADGSQGFPGEVVSNITYTVTPNTWHFKMTAKALTKKTPIMLSSHTYWNLDGFQNPETPLVLNHSLWLPYSKRRVDVDGILIPTGKFLNNDAGSVNDFWKAPRQLGSRFTDPEIHGNCGPGCTGYDTCYLVDREEGPKTHDAPPVARLSSAWSGIQLDIFTDQVAFQVYSCNGQNGSLALKRTQGFFNDATQPRVTQQYGCLVMEVEDYIDGINNPQWGRQKEQIFGPGDKEYELEASYVFSVK